MQRVSVPKLAMAEVTKSGENRRKVATVPALVSMYQRTLKVSIEQELDPVGSTVRYEVMKLCPGSVLDSNGLGGTESALVVQVGKDTRNCQGQ